MAYCNGKCIKTKFTYSVFRVLLTPGINSCRCARECILLVVYGTAQFKLDTCTRVSL